MVTMGWKCFQLTITGSKWKKHIVLLSLFSFVLYLISLLILGFHLKDSHNANRKEHLNDWSLDHPPNYNFEVLVASTKEGKGIRRLLRTAKINHLPLKLLGREKIWKDWKNIYKVNLYRDYLEGFKNDSSRIFLLADATDTLFNGGVAQILNTFKIFEAKILFSAEDNCWPDSSICERYPKVRIGKRYLNSGLIIGYASELYRMLTAKPTTVSEKHSDQHYFTLIYLEEEWRRELGIQLDHRSQLFQTFEGSLSNDIELHYQGSGVSVINKHMGTNPIIMHTPGFCKMLGNLLTVFLPNVWSPKGQCSDCFDENTDLAVTKLEDYPMVMVTVNVAKESPDRVLSELQKLDYPKEKIHLSIVNAGKEYVASVRNFSQHHGHQFSSFKLVHRLETTYSEFTHNETEMSNCVLGCLFYLDVDATTRLDDTQFLKLLVEKNPIGLAPMVHRSDSYEGNFFTFLYGNVGCLNSFNVVGRNYRVTIGHF